MSYYRIQWLVNQIIKYRGLLIIYVYIYIVEYLRSDKKNIYYRIQWFANTNIYHYRI